MVNQNKIFSFKIKYCQANNVFPSDVERTVVPVSQINGENVLTPGNVAVMNHRHPKEMKEGIWNKSDKMNAA